MGANGWTLSIMVNAFGRYLGRFLPLPHGRRTCSANPSYFRHARGHHSDWTKLLQAALPRAVHLPGGLPIAGPSGRDCGNLHDRKRKRTFSRYSTSQRNRTRASELPLRCHPHRSHRAGSATGARIHKGHCARTVSLLLMGRSHQDWPGTERAVSTEQWPAEPGNPCNYNRILVSLQPVPSGWREAQEQRTTREEILNLC